MAAKAKAANRSKSIAERTDGILRAVETGVVDVQTIAALKRLLVVSPPIEKTSMSRTKKTSKPAANEEHVPNAEIVSAAKTIVMKSLTTLASEVEMRAKRTENDTTTTPQPISQGMKNVASCCKLALDSLRLWQTHPDIGVTWVNKGYMGYIGKLIGMDMVLTSVKFLK